MNFGKSLRRKSYPKKKPYVINRSSALEGGLAASVAPQPEDETIRFRIFANAGVFALKLFKQGECAH